MRKNLSELHYTIYDDPFVDQTIADQIKEVSKVLLKELEDILALYLLGGYARGEGSVLLGSNGIVPLGDYDFLVISRFPHPSFSSKISGVEALQKKFRIQYHIEVDVVWKYLLPFVGKRIYWYENKFGSRLIFGKANLVDLIPIYEADDIDLNEGISLMSNRLVGMHMVFDPKFLECDPSEEQRRHLIFQSVKAILGCGDSLLLLNGKYHCSYRERCQRFLKSFKSDFPELSVRDSSLEDDYKKATYFKLKPDFGMYEKPVRFWFTAKRHVLETLSFFKIRTMSGLNNFSGALIDLTDFPDFLLRGSKPGLLDFTKFNWNAIRHLKSFKGLRWISSTLSDVVRTSLFYLAISMREDGEIDQEPLERALTVVSKIIPIGRGIREEKNLTKKWRLVRDVVVLAWTMSRK